MHAPLSDLSIFLSRTRARDAKRERETQKFINNSPRRGTPVLFFPFVAAESYR